MSDQYTIEPDSYLKNTYAILASNIMREGFGIAKTAKGCRGAIRRGLRRTYGSSVQVFERQGWYSDEPVIGSDEADHEWAVRISSYITNPNFWVEPETYSTLTVYKN